MIPRFDPIQEDSAVQPGSIRPDQPGVTEEAKLAARRLPAQTKLGRQARRSPRSDGQRRDDPASRRIREQLDPLSVALWHVVPEFAAQPCTRTKRPLRRAHAPLRKPRRADATLRKPRRAPTRRRAAQRRRRSASQPPRAAAPPPLRLAAAPRRRAAAAPPRSRRAKPRRLAAAAQSRAAAPAAAAAR